MHQGRKYGGSHGKVRPVPTAIITETLLSNFQYLPSGRAAQQVLTGTYVVPLDTPKYVLEFLATLVMPETICKLGLVDLSISHTITPSVGLR